MKPKETLEFKMIRSKQTFSFNPPFNLVEEGKWLLGVSSLEGTNSVFNITNENNFFSITIPGQMEKNSAGKTTDELNKILKLRSLELDVKEVTKRGNKMKIGDNKYKLSDFKTQKNDILDELGNVKFNDLEDLVYRMQLTSAEIIDILDLKYAPIKRIGYGLKPNIYQIRYKKDTIKNF